MCVAARQKSVLYEEQLQQWSFMAALCRKRQLNRYTALFKLVAKLRHTGRFSQAVALSQCN